MQHYLVDRQTQSGIQTAFPQTPTDFPLSFQDYLEDKLANGYALQSLCSDGGNFTIVFRVVAK